MILKYSLFPRSEITSAELQKPVINRDKYYARYQGRGGGWGDGIAHYIPQIIENNFVI